MFINQLKYKAQENSIECIVIEESYTSKASFLDNDDIPVYDKSNKEKPVFSGKRIKRGLYSSKNGMLINADANGAYNILHKAIPNAFADGIEGVGLHPFKVNVA